MKALTLPSFFRPACLSLLSSVALATQATAAEGTVTVTITEKDKSQTIIETKPVTDQEALVQIAILLDTSSSMNGLIEQAKTQLWKIVNEFNDAKQGDKTPVVQVALYEYGNNGLSVGSNYIRQVLPFTRDLDKVSEQLFKLTTNGGDEYCGAVIREALDKLAWDKDGQVYKAIFIAGNEPFTQGPVNSQDACKAAIQKGVVVNTIHCGNQGDGENGGWRTGAALAEGRFLTIDQDKAIVHIEAPQDKEITQLSIELNKTYIMYGKDGRRGASNQVAQDSNASFYEKAGAAVQRALTKANSSYSNGGWDLVDANKKSGIKLDKIPEADLPPEVKALAPEKRQAYLDEKAAEREKIQAQINKLNEERQKYVAEKAKESGANDTLDKAMVKAVREQAAKKAITFK